LFRKRLSHAQFLSWLYVGHHERTSLFVNKTALDDTVKLQLKHFLFVIPFSKQTTQLLSGTQPLNSVPDKVSCPQFVTSLCFENTAIEVKVTSSSVVPVLMES
jgi:hypothetical protein